MIHKASGTENLRADHKVKSSGDLKTTPGGGTDMGGKSNLRANHQVKSGSQNDTPSGSKDKRPSRVQNFDSLAGDR